MPELNIYSNIEIRGGKPCVIGTRISVFDILNWLENGMSYSQIISDFPELTLTDIKDSVLFFQNNKNIF